MTTLYFQQQNTVMVRIPKTGGTSIVNGIFGGINNATLKKRGSFPANLSGKPSFVMVRNPFDRLVSAYIMFKKYPVNNKNEEAFQEKLTLARLLTFIADNQCDINGRDYFSKLHYHTLKQSSNIFPIDKVDKVYKFENFDDAYKDIYFKARALPCKQVPHLRQAEREDYRNYFDSNSQRIAEILFEDDCASFSYNF